MQTLNKGEWSEIYCVLKIISDGKLNLCDAQLKPTNQEINVLGGKISSNISYIIEDNNIKFNIYGKDKIFQLEDMSKLANRSLQYIKTSPQKTFSMPEMAELFGTNSLKAKASDKIDTIINVYDDLTNTEEELGFSIKSFLAGSPTLVNASKATTFTYNVKITSIDDKYIDLKCKTLLKKLYIDNKEIVFEQIDSNIYQNNLMKIDLRMPEILAEFLKIYYSSKTKIVSKITEQLQNTNPLKLSDVSLYKSKITDYLFYSATGMFPNKIWNGVQDIDGGCLIVEKDGVIKSFYIFRKSFLIFFREYLFTKCFLDTPSTTKFKFGKVYEKENCIKLKLNLQIRIAA